MTAAKVMELDAFAAQCPRELCMVVGLVSKGSRRALTAAQRSVNEIHLVDIQSPTLLAEARAVVASLGVHPVDCHRLAYQAVAKGDLALFQACVVQPVYFRSGANVVAYALEAIQLGRLRILQWLGEAPSWGWYAEANIVALMHAAVRGGSVGVVSWLSSTVRGGTRQDCWKWAQDAAGLGHVQLLQWMFPSREATYGGLRIRQCAVFLMSAAARGEVPRYAVLDWILDACRTPPPYPLLGSQRGLWRIAIKRGSTGLMQYLRGRTGTTPAGLCYELARCGKLQCLQWARANGASWDATVAGVAVRYGQWESLYWMLGQDPPVPLPQPIEAAIAEHYGEAWRALLGVQA